MPDLSGIFPPLPTSFDQHENLSVSGIKENILSLGSFDLAGFLLLGSNGEKIMLDYKEKVKVLEAAREAIPEGKLFLAGTGENSTRQTIRLTNAAANTGADAVLVLNPFYYKNLMNRQALVDHYFAVADASRVPVIIYNMPSNTGIDMDATTILSISRHPNIIGIKDSGGNMVKMGEIIRNAKEGFQVLAGSASFLLPALAMGAKGGILALANIAPAQCISVYNKFKKGEIESARRLQHDMISLNTAVTSRWGVPALKAAMDYLGFCGGVCRRPVAPLDKNNIEDLKKLLDEKLNKPEL